MGDVLTFSEALSHLRSGVRIARLGWNGKGMWLALVRQSDWKVAGGTWGDAMRKLPWIAMKTADNAFVPWLASQTDILADDWLVLD